MRRRRLLRATAFVAASGVLVPGPAARAEQAVYGRRFGPTPVLSPYLTLDGSHTLGDGGAGFHALASYERRPMIFEDGGQRTLDIISERWATDLTLTYGFLPRLDFGVNLPLVVSQSGRGLDATGLTSFAVADPALALKFEILDKTHLPVGLAVVGQATLPLGDPEALAGEAASTMGGRLVLEIPRGHRMDYAINLGYRARQNTRVEELVLNDELTAGLGVSGRLHGRVQLMGEVTAATRANAPFDSVAESPADANLGLRIRIWQGLHVTVGGGAGLVPGYGSPTWRTFLGLEAAPRRHDFDGDQVADGDDDCEDTLGLIGEHGCPARPIVAKPLPAPPRKPENDADEDHVTDDVDQCPFLAEDQDRFQDADGCPDPDNDLDLLADAYDGDPIGPEDWDAFEDDDGIPDPDNDRDGVADLEDKCPLQAAETETGCPGDRAVASGSPSVGAGGAPQPEADGPLLLGDTLHPAVPIIFEFAEPRLTPSAEQAVDGVAEYLKRHPELGTFEVGVHVDGLGNRRWKLYLSHARAETLVAALVSRGVPAERLVARGYGFDVPVAEDTTPQGRALNRRVELRMVGRSAEAAADKEKPTFVPSPEGVRGPVLRPEPPIAFEAGGAALSSASWPAIDMLARSLRAHPEWKRVEIGVHTDGRGDPRRKLRLSQERAETVRRALVAAGVAAGRLVGRGFGAAVPIASDENREGRAANRRVELTVLGAPGGHRPGTPTPSHGQGEGHAPLSQGDAGAPTEGKNAAEDEE